MAYFLKVAKQQNNTYLAVYESFYLIDHLKQLTKHRNLKLSDLLIVFLILLLHSTSIETSLLLM